MPGSSVLKRPTGRRRRKTHESREITPLMKDATKRTIFRTIHIVFSIPILGYIYSPFENIPNYATPTRFVFVPVLVLSGLWMWKGQALRRLFTKRATRGLF